jgi:hypothetical protein
MLFLGAKGRTGSWDILPWRKRSISLPKSRNKENAKKVCQHAEKKAEKMTFEFRRRIDLLLK